jgi:hypothetical protein
MIVVEFGFGSQKNPWRELGIFCVQGKGQIKVSSAAEFFYTKARRKKIKLNAERGMLNASSSFD